MATSAPAGISAKNSKTGVQELQNTEEMPLRLLLTSKELAKGEQGH